MMQVYRVQEWEDHEVGDCDMATGEESDGYERNRIRG